ncbi:MAG: YncE family protein [Acidobacteria bacterium]|nr:YncE family protein [Acidobacteriota bacterium]
MPAPSARSLRVLAIALALVPLGLALSPAAPPPASAQGPGPATADPNADPNERAAAQPPEADPHRRRSTIYVANRGSSDVMAFSRDSSELIATIPVGKAPSGLAARRDGDRIFVASAGTHAVQVIDGVTRKVLDTLSLTHGSAPAHLVLSPDERTLWVAGTGTDTVYAIDAGSLQQIAEIEVGRGPTRLAVSPDGRRVYALCTQAGRLSMIDATDPRRPRVIASPSVGSLPGDLAVDPVRGTVYVVHPGAPVLHAVEEGAVESKEIGIESPIDSVAADGPSRRLLLASSITGRILLMSPFTAASTKIIPVSDVTRFVIDPEGRNLYALSPNRGVLITVNRIVGSVDREVKAGKEPWDLVLIP